MRPIYRALIAASVAVPTVIVGVVCASALLGAFPAMVVAGVGCLWAAERIDEARDPESYI